MRIEEWTSKDWHMYLHFNEIRNRTPKRIEPVLNTPPNKIDTCKISERLAYKMGLEKSWKYRSPEET